MTELLPKVVPKIVRIISKPEHVVEFEAYPFAVHPDPDDSGYVFGPDYSAQIHLESGSEEEMTPSDYPVSGTGRFNRGDDVIYMYSKIPPHTRLRYARTFLYEYRSRKTKTPFAKFIDRLAKTATTFCSVV